MPAGRRGRPRRRRWRLEGPHAPGSLGDWALRYLEWLEVRNYSADTVRNREVYLDFFLRWCEARTLLRPEEVTKPLLERYQRHLFYYRKENGRPLSFRSQHGRLVAVRAYFKWLTRQNILLYNPASELELPRLGRHLPKHVLTVAEVERVLAVPHVSEPLGLRDRAILETLYATGMRRKELVHLGLYDVDTERRTARIRFGKGGRERVVPMGERAVRWVERYVHEVRPRLVVPPDDGTLFLSALGEPLVPSHLTALVRELVNASGIHKKGSCHLFRHTMATLMLEHGAELRFVQEMLGHADPKTTQIYTHLSITKLHQIHAATHPGARLEARGRNADEATDGSAAEALLSSLAAEEHEELDGDA